jgi:hypothetical protein
VSRGVQVLTSFAFISGGYNTFRHGERNRTMPIKPANNTPSAPRSTPPELPPPVPAVDAPPLIPLPNYTLASVCPACDYPTIRRACKVRCERCGFVWDCSEL